MGNDMIRVRITTKWVGAEEFIEVEKERWNSMSHEEKLEIVLEEVWLDWEEIE